jgi:hypothetical protein
MASTTKVDEILQQARPVLHQRGHETQPYGHLATLAIALEESTCKKSVENLNQLLADIPRPPKGREPVPVQISRLLFEHEVLVAVNYSART